MPFSLSPCHPWPRVQASNFPPALIQPGSGPDGTSGHMVRAQAFCTSWRPATLFNKSSDMYGAGQLFRPNSLQISWPPGAFCSMHGVFHHPKALGNVIWPHNQRNFLFQVGLSWIVDCHIWILICGNNLCYRKYIIFCLSQHILFFSLVSITKLKRGEAGK